MSRLLVLKAGLEPLLYPETFRFLAYLSTGLIVLSIIVRMAWTLPLDRAATIRIQQIHWLPLTRLSHVLTFLGNSSTLIVFALVSIAVGALVKEPRVGWFVAGTLIALPINALLKKLVSRARPGLDDARVLPGPRWGFSYPSGHSMGSAAFYGFLAAQLYLHGWADGWKLVVMACIIALPIGVGLSRIYLGAHWMSDVVGGWAGGAIISFATMAVFQP
jgi:membrane-associated phospholipid phosphatase